MAVLFRKVPFPFDHESVAVATAFARSHSYYQARLAADRCTASNNKLDAFAAILQYTIQRHPDFGVTR